MIFQKSIWNGFFQFLLWLLPVAAVQAIGGWVTATSVTTWYTTLQKPSWNPPDWVFGPVWTVLYLLLALSAWLVYRSQASHQQKKIAYIAFFTQLFLNLLWTILFFGFQSPFLALVNLFFLLISIDLTAILFYRAQPLAGYLLIPYLVWTTYAFSLNAAIWWKN